MQSTPTSNVKPNKDTPWAAFGHMYLGLVLSRFQGYEWSNQFPHRIEDAPPFYTNVSKLLESLLERDSGFDPKAYVTCKRFYRLLVDMLNVTPRCLQVVSYKNDKNEDVNIPYKRLFLDLKCPMIDPITISVTYKLLHNALPTGYNLRHWNIPAVGPCLYCTPSFETEEHLFFQCTLVCTAKNWIQNVCFNFFEIDIKQKEIVKGLFDSDVSHRNLALFLLAEYRFAVWSCRNKWRFGHKEQKKNDVLYLLKNRINNRMLIDKKRLSSADFVNTWVLPGFCRFNRLGKIVSLLP